MVSNYCGFSLLFLRISLFGNIFGPCCLLIILLLLFNQPSAYAEVATTSRPLKLVHKTSQYALGPYIQIFEDKNRNLTIDQVSSATYSDQFVQNNSGSINWGISESYYWFRFTLAPVHPPGFSSYSVSGIVPSQWLLYLGKQLDYYDQIDVYWTQEGDSGNWKTSSYGLYHAVDQGQRDPLCMKFSFSENNPQPITVYIKLITYSGFFIEPIIYSLQGFHEFSSSMSIFHGIYYGLVLSMIIYNLFHYFFLRDRVRLIFILYATTLCIYFVVANELSLTLLPTEFLVQTRKFAQFLGLITIAQIAWFTSEFLEAKKNMRVIYRFLQLLIVVSIGLIFLLPFISYLSMGKIIADFSLLGVLTVMCSGFVAWFRGYRPARFFLLAWFFFLGGGVIYILNFKGVFPYAFIGNNAYQAGSGIEMLLLSLAIADRVKFLFDQLLATQNRRQQQLNALTEQLVQTEERERRRVAGILHDSLGQTLVATKWEVQRLLRKVPENGQEKSLAISYLESCIEETRSLTAELYPQALYERGLGIALKVLAEDFARRFGLVIEVKVDKEPHITGEEHRFILYRAVSELLNNVIKHADADRVEIWLQCENGDVKVSVVDNGIGFTYFPEYSLNNSGFGLFSIQERLNRIGGILAICRADGGGSRVTIQTPLVVGQQ